MAVLLSRWVAVVADFFGTSCPLLSLAVVPVVSGLVAVVPVVPGLGFGRPWLWSRSLAPSYPSLSLARRVHLPLLVRGHAL